MIFILQFPAPNSFIPKSANWSCQIIQNWLILLGQIINFVIFGSKLQQIDSHDSYKIHKHFWNEKYIFYNFKRPIQKLKILYHAQYSLKVLGTNKINFAIFVNIFGTYIFRHFWIQNLTVVKHTYLCSSKRWLNSFYIKQWATFRMSILCTPGYRITLWYTVLCKTTHIFKYNIKLPDKMLHFKYSE